MSEVLVWAANIWARVGDHVGGSQPVESAIFAGGKAARRGEGQLAVSFASPPVAAPVGRPPGAATLFVFRNSML